MNYKKIHDDLIEYCKTTDYITRMKNRNPNDSRLSKEYIYTEWHHIIPVSQGGDNSKDNLVELLPEEHYIVHLLRYKAFGNRNDFLAIRFMVNGYNNLTYRQLHSYKRKIQIHKQLIQEFRKTTGWQSKEGKENISKARKGKVPVLCEDGVIRSISNKDPDYLSGKLSHHTKGKHCYYDETGNKIFITTKEAKLRGLKAVNKDMSGDNNTNARPMTSEHKQRILDNFHLFVEEGHYRPRLLSDNLASLFPEFKKISMMWIKNRLGKSNDIVKWYNNETGSNIKFNPYFRSSRELSICKQTLTECSKRRWANYRNSKC